MNLEFLPSLLLGLAIISLFFRRSQKGNFISSALITAAIVSALANGNILFTGLFYILATAFILYFAVSDRLKNRWFKFLFHLLFIGLSLALIAHIVPGFNNIKVFDAIKFSENSVPFTMFLNFDKPIIGIIIVAVLGLELERPLNYKFLILNISACALVLLAGAYSLSYIALDPKWPANAWLWAANNLIFVCFAEEAFFRRYVQGGLSQTMRNFRYGKYLALLSASLLFGLAHFKGGPSYIALSTIAGVFYGYSYLKTSRLEAPILTHFFLNLLHFSLFSYPALQ